VRKAPLLQWFSSRSFLEILENLEISLQNSLFAGKILPETGAVGTASPARHSLDLRLRSMCARRACIFRDFHAFPMVSWLQKVGNYGENLRKVSSHNRKNSRFGETFSGDKFRSHWAVGAAGEEASSDHGTSATRTAGDLAASKSDHYAFEYFFSSSRAI